MKNNGQITKTKTQIMRSLKVLVPLIKRDLYQIDRYRKQSDPYRLAAGEKLVEAKGNHQDLKKVGGWGAWLEKNFTLSRASAERYMDFFESEVRKARRRGTAHSEHFETQQDEAEAYTEFLNKGDVHGRGSGKKAKATIGAIVGGIDADIYAQKLQDRQTEITLRRELAEKLVEAGFRLLAKELHPDKGGSGELMRRLKAVKEALMELVPMIGSEVEV